MSNFLFPSIFFFGLLLGWSVRWGYGRLHSRNTITAERGSQLEFTLVVAAFIAMHFLPLIFCFTPWLRFANYHLPHWIATAGVIIYAAGLWLFWRSHADLGRNWSPIPRIREGQSLVTSGVYRGIRHPMYAAHWLGGIGQALLLGNWVAGPLFLLLFLPIYLLRIAREEQLMVEHFGEEYRQYMARTARILPRLSWRPSGIF